MAGYWPSLLFVRFWTRRQSRSIDAKKLHCKINSQDLSMPSLGFFIFIFFEDFSFPTLSIVRDQKKIHKNNFLPKLALNLL